MYCDLWKHYWWSRMKKHIVEHVARCFNSQQMKYEYQRSGGFLQSYQSSIQMTLYGALYGRRCRFSVGWVKPKEARLLGIDLVCDALEKVKLIQECLRTVEYMQMSYANNKARDVAFMVCERVLLRVLTMKGMIRFKKSSKLSPRLRKYYEDPSHVLDFSSVQLNKDLTYDEEPLATLDRHVRKLRSKNIRLVKVQWKGIPVEEANWETGNNMQGRYPHLFGISGMTLNLFEDARLCKRWRK
ncbi:PREDICTED: uncharacterized protein LOC109226057 [Nicotiana attenuata]|uniref:uncharacterized protein LOC109226057 n=1 Tax=Nicotiana attenuata TaxID=49451 RepID=UPI000904DFC1|nr:PREDICTED: uncharacterized protein LOC109226057 [Nicotiana attenuata]